MRYLVFTIIFLFTLTSAAQDIRKKAHAIKIVNPPQINGELDDPAWAGAEVIEGFSQYLPLHGSPPSFPTQVKILYDDQAVYIGAFMSDPYPDSIPMQLGNRDDENMNVDYFGVEFDTYNNQLDAYIFMVTSAGVQIDSRETDETYDGVWMSASKLREDGWVAEMKIPYSALRFASVPRQVWGLQLIRYLRRNRETNYWSQEKQGAENNLVYWGELHNIENIEPPLRLSVTPYLSGAIEHFPNEKGKDISSSFSGGMDLKLGVNESYTLDMTLLPDFSQVKSDDKIKNLTAFETIYSEQRPFFKEAVDLFEKGDIFYSRRIGKLPQEFYNVENKLSDSERIIKNPVQQKLLNATKISGRGKSGLALGILNAVTNNTYAIVEDNNGIQRKILTDPASNYNVFVLSQALKNNSEIFISNANLIRAKGYPDANNTAAGIKLNDKTNTYVLNINGGVSQNYTPEGSGSSDQSVEIGYKAYAGIGKTNGNFLFTLIKGAMNDSYDANATGITLYNNYHTNYASFSYNVYNPWWILRDLSNTIGINNENNYLTGKAQSANLFFRSFGTTMKYLTVWLRSEYRFMKTYDYYEPRTTGYFFLAPKYFTADAGISSDYRKAIAIDANFTGGRAPRDGTTLLGINIHPIFRVSNHFIFDYGFNYEKEAGEIGYADSDPELLNPVIFGKRDIITVINTLNGKYLFRNDLSLNLSVRHYWAQGNYANYFTLLHDGTLLDNPDYTGNKDFNFNTFTIDMVFSWEFSPGSRFTFVWKNSIDPPDENYPVPNYFSNLRKTFESPQRNTLSVKLLYYLDYQMLKRNKTRS